MSNVFSGVCIVSKDAEVRYLPSGMAVLNLNCANHVGFGDKQQTLWLQVSLFGKRAESGVVSYLKKGQHVFVSGELSTREYQANDGTTRTSLDLIANVLDLVGKKSDNNQAGQESYPSSAPASRAPQSAPAQQPSNSSDNFNDAPYDDDIPF
ncbi:MAG: single-stranded DNA-binding protein [Methylococcales bacterium]|nr:single-stranded DNA-binding protein [Methylococcales bacterium]